MSGRTCYKSEDKITEDSAEKFVEMLTKRGHHAMIEFGDIIIKCVTNRGVAHEIVRHRMCSFAQESTRYVRYDEGDMQYIWPVWSNIKPGYYVRGDYIQKVDVDKDIPMGDQIWLDSCIRDEENYKRLIKDCGWKAQQAREILNNSLKTEIVWKANIREWRHILKLRCGKAAHPQMRDLMIPILKDFQSRIPVLFDDIKV